MYYKYYNPCAVGEGSMKRTLIFEKVGDYCLPMMSPFVREDSLWLADTNR
jgi:hypothetical protein